MNCIKNFVIYLTDDDKEHSSDGSNKDDNLHTSVLIPAKEEPTSDDELDNNYSDKNKNKSCHPETSETYTDQDEDHVNDEYYNDQENDNLDDQINWDDGVEKGTKLVTKLRHPPITLPMRDRDNPLQQNEGDFQLKEPIPPNVPTFRELNQNVLYSV